MSGVADDKSDVVFSDELKCLGDMVRDADVHSKNDIVAQVTGRVGGVEGIAGAVGEVGVHGGGGGLIAEGTPLELGHQ